MAEKPLPEEQELLFTPETLRQLARDIDDLRHRILFDMESAGAEVMAEQFYLDGLAFLELAQRAMSKAAISQTKGLVEALR